MTVKASAAVGTGCPSTSTTPDDRTDIGRARPPCGQLMVVVWLTRFPRFPDGTASPPRSAGAPRLSLLGHGQSALVDVDLVSAERHGRPLAVVHVHSGGVDPQP